MATAEGAVRETGIAGRVRRHLAEYRERKNSERLEQEYQEELGKVNQSLRFLVPEMRGIITSFGICHDFRRNVDTKLRPESIEQTAGFRELKNLEKIPGVTVGAIQVFAEAPEDVGSARFTVHIPITLTSAS